jgi:ABC-2 type transport system ATP-binding protein
MNAVTTEVAAASPGFAVSCRNIHKHFGIRKVLSNVSLSIPKGAVLGLVGRNGAGKSTLLRILVGLLMPDYGSASIWGESALHLTDAASATCSYASCSRLS